MDEKFNDKTQKNDEDQYELPFPEVADEDLKYLTEAPEIADWTEFIKSDMFADECRKQYREKVQEFLLKRKMFTLVDALEMTIDFWNYGDNLTHYPLANTYIPVRNTIMKKPNLMNQDDIDDELGY